MNFFTTSAVSCHKRTQPQSLHTHTDLVYQPESLQATPVPKSIPAAVRVLLQAGCQCHSCRPTDSDNHWMVAVTQQQTTNSIISVLCCLGQHVWSISRSPALGHGTERPRYCADVPFSNYSVTPALGQAQYLGSTQLTATEWILQRYAPRSSSEHLQGLTFKKANTTMTITSTFTMIIMI